TIFASNSLKYMLSRRHLRIKALQALYAFFQSENTRLDLGEKELIKSLDKLYEIYIYQLSLLIEINSYARKRIEENKLKFYPTEEDQNPNTRFIENRFVLKLIQNKNLSKKIEEYKISWVDQEDMIRKLFVKIRDSEDYKAYMSSENNNYKEDINILLKITKKFISKDEILQFHYEEKSIYWSDDFYTSNLLLLKTLKTFPENSDELTPLPSLLSGSKFDDTNEDREFLIQLFRKVILKSDYFYDLMEEKVKNWEMDRLAVMDILIIKMALAELIEFPSIPIKVTLNEYIELAKYYSTPKSKFFVNGILDKLIVDLKAQEKIKKTGRGLIE
ncbi:MAG: transcription antitermination factor NusB, partial [Bacteroidales bacterium]|nr:transcription antitermination factor NusB [Bacteroidales bacterium]